MIVHIAGLDITIDNRLRQRCGWCGATLMDYDLTRVMVPVDQPGRPGTWPVGALIAVDGNTSYVIEPKDGKGRLPEGACGRLDPDVTT